MRRSSSPLGWILTLVPLAMTVTVLFVLLVLAVTTVKGATPAAPSYRVVKVGGLEYEAMLGRPVDPADPVDRQIVRGLPVREQRTARGQTLFGAFISVTNDSQRAIQAASRIELRDTRGHVYHPLHLPPSNAYAYSPGLIPPRTRIPRLGSTADDNLAATGKLVLFGIPAWRYDNDVLELIIHDPQHPTHAAYLVI